MNKLIQILGLMAFSISSLHAADSECVEHYAAGLERMSKGEFAEASAEFQETISIYPTPETGITNYLPYIHLSVAAHKAERNHLAREALIQSQVHGIAKDTPLGAQLLEQYAAAIMEAPLDSQDAPLPELHVSEFRDLEQDNISLTPEHIASIRSAVLKRCGLSSRLNANKLPWYFHYEFGIDLARAGDAGHSLDAFMMSANLREESHRRARMYGMRHVDYLPYYRIALAHANLGNWESAYDALLASENFEEFTPEDNDYETFTALDQLVKSNLKNNDS
jgi:hypothetical protein